MYEKVATQNYQHFVHRWTDRQTDKRMDISILPKILVLHGCKNYGEPKCD